MATEIQNAGTILDALLNQPATATQKTRAVAAFKNDPTDTNADAARNFMAYFRELFFAHINLSEGKVNVTTAQATTKNDIANSFPVAP